MTIGVSIIGEICRLYVFLILILAALGKTRNVEQFRENLVLSFYVPERESRWVAFTIIGVEWMLAFGLIVGGRITFLATIGSGLLFSVFTIIIAVALSQNRMINCNCFGSENKMLSKYDLLRNFCVLASIIILLTLNSHLNFHLLTFVLATPFVFILFQISMNLDVIAILIKRQGGMEASDDR